MVKIFLFMYILGKLVNYIGLINCVGVNYCKFLF